MALLDLYSRRKRDAAKAGADVYQYVSISNKLRRQLVFVFEDCTKALSSSYWDSDEVWSDAVAVMRRELGRSELTEYSDGSYMEFANWFLKEQDIDAMLDGLEVITRLTAYAFKDRNYGRLSSQFDRHMVELNARLLEGGLGFQMEQGHIVKVSSQFVHAEVVVPALSLLSSPKLATADQEFRKAHAEYRAGSYEDCLTDCCKAFESVLKVISAEKNWGVAENATAKPLIQAVYDNKLIPDYMQNEFSALRSLLESAVPTVRNKASGHGQGAKARTVDANLAEFQLHQTAAAILFLVKQAGI
ncbi:STM4504/CBY_0614 family protein [Sphingomonas oryzagri]